MKNTLLKIVILIIILNIIKKKMITYNLNDNFLNNKSFGELLEYKNNFFKELKKDKNLVYNSKFKNISYYFNLEYLDKMKLDLLFKNFNEILKKSPKTGNYLVVELVDISLLNKFKVNSNRDKRIYEFLNSDELKIHPEIVSILFLNKCGELVILGSYNQNIKYKSKSNRLIYFNGGYTYSIKGYSKKCKENNVLILKIYDFNNYHLSLLPKIHMKFY